MTHPKWNKAQPNPKAIDLLTRLGQASTAGILHGPGSGFHTLLHSEPQQQYQGDVSEISRRLMGATPEEYQHLPGWRRGANEFATGIITDPLTVLDPLIGGMTRSAATHALPLTMRASQAAIRKGVPGAKLAAAAGGGLHDFLTAGGPNAAHALRHEALTNGAEGVDNYRRLYSLRGAADAQRADLSNTLSQGFRRAIQGLPEGDRLTVYRAIHNGGIDKLPPNLQSVAKQVVAYDRAIPYLSGTKSLRTQMEKNGYALPQDVQRFDIGNEFMPTRARGTVRTSNFRQNHIPLPHELDPEDAARLEKRLATGATSKQNAADVTNLQFRKRRPQDPDSAFMPIEDANLIEELFHSSFRRAGRSLSASDLQHRVATLFSKPQELQARLGSVTPQDLSRASKLRTNSNPADLSFAGRREPSIVPPKPTSGKVTLQRYADVPSHIKQFFVEPGKQAPKGRAAEVLQELAPFSEGAKAASDISRSSLFLTPIPHQARILSLLALHAPEAIPGALAKYAKLGIGLAGRDRQAQVLGAAQHAGASGLPNIEQSRLVNLLNKGGAPGKALGKWYDTSGKMLWGWDNAAKAALYEKNLKRYKDPLLAAYHTQQSLVNYERPSPFISAARTVESFPTWRARMPGAVLKGIAEHPRNAAAIARLLGGVGFGATVAAGGKDGRKTSASAPGEAAQLLDDPREYARGSLSPSGKLAAAGLNWLLDHGKGGDPGYWIYNKAVFPGKNAGRFDPGFLLGESPGYNQIAPLLGGGMMKTTPQDQLLMQALGIQTIEPRAKVHHRPRHHARR